MRVLKALPVPFAVKGGGHTSNPGFSSTPGIQISLLRFNKISFNDNKTELTVGAGCVFDEIYKVEEEVGIGGWIMGGGYSLKTNQYGLGIDNLVRSQIVLPDGRRVTASADAESDLFWAIKGGGNNFGIATEFVLKTHRQGTNGNGYVYGGLLTFDEAHVEHVKAAIVDFVTRNDPKAAIVAAFRFYRNHSVQEFKFTVLAFYDDMKPDGSDPFSHFLAITHQGRLANSDYTTVDVATNLLYSYVLADVATAVLSNSEGDDSYSFPSSEIAGMSVMNARARWGTIMVSKYTSSLINVVEEEAKMKTALDHIHRIALQEGCTTPSAPVYCNTTLEDVTTPEQIYRDNLELSALRIRYDPDNVMERTGGFRIPFPFGPATVDEH
ncbi:hypothetical protein EDB86DRAFT_2833631 [Lactarius hatsudake]|nr:hypothetical protein EDB86DRAFT_2833631 [Lactarius hatsudake]